jgi:hypothetical protein
MYDLAPLGGRLPWWELSFALLELFIDQAI